MSSITFGPIIIYLTREYNETKAIRQKSFSSKKYFVKNNGLTFVFNHLSIY